MRKTLLLALGLLAFTAKADLIIYKEKLTITFTGGGASGKTTYGGWMITDGQTGDITLIHVNAAQKRFSVEALDDYTFGYVTGTLGKRNQVIQIFTGNGSITAKGTVSASGVDVGTDTGYTVAKTYTVTGADYDVDGETLKEWKGNFVFDAKSSVQANTNAFNIDSAVAAVRSNLTGQGYVED